jgi:hypothetical protein
MVNPKFELSSGFAHQFSKVNPTFNLNEELQKFRRPKPLEEHHSLSSEYINMLGWMLRNEVIVEIHPYVYLLPMDNEEINDGSAECILFDRYVSI